MIQKCLTCGNEDSTLIEYNVFQESDVCQACGETLFDYVETSQEVINQLRQLALVDELENIIL